jgi:hypothetical protein
MIDWAWRGSPRSSARSAVLGRWLSSTRLRVDIVVNNLVGFVVTTGKVLIQSDGTPWRPLVHIEDISRACLAVLHAPRGLVRSVSRLGLKQWLGIELSPENGRLLYVPKGFAQGGLPDADGRHRGRVPDAA